VAPVWNEPARARTRDAFRKTGQTTADETFAHVDSALQRRLAGWASAHRDACEATKVRHEQSDELFDRRMDCLGQARKEIAAFVELLGKIDARGLDRAAVAAGEAGDIGTCARTATPGPAVPLPRDPQVRREIDVLQAELARLTGLRILAQYKAGSALVADILPRARATGYEPVLAEALLLRSWFESNADDKAGALRDLYEVVSLASEARDDMGLARATNLIASVAAAGKGGFAAADVAYQLALGATARAGNQPALLWQLLHNRANVLYDKGEMTTALAFYQLQLLVAAPSRTAPTAGRSPWRFRIWAMR